MFSYGFHEIFKNNFFTEDLRNTASDHEHPPVRLFSSRVLHKFQARSGRKKRIENLRIWFWNI